LSFVIPLTILLIFLLLYFHFKNLTESLIVMASLPFALVGGFVSVLALQPYTSGESIGFAWQIVIGSAISFFIMQTQQSREQIFLNKGH
jgi:Cu(I)/Ag(I) efflux system membrane protein CusA/SilA